MNGTMQNPSRVVFWWVGERVFSDRAWGSIWNSSSTLWEYQREHCSLPTSVQSSQRRKTLGMVSVYVVSDTLWSCCDSINLFLQLLQYLWLLLEDVKSKPEATSGRHL